jgi:hypothetical protein
MNSLLEIANKRRHGALQLATDAFFVTNRVDSSDLIDYFDRVQSSV